jgi:hypothetical protein
MLEAIYACKMYRSSTRKDKIRANFESPVNAELVGQLAKALDDDYKKPEYLVKDYEEKKEEARQEEQQQAEEPLDTGATEPDDSALDSKLSSHSRPSTSHAPSAPKGDEPSSEPGSEPGAEPSGPAPEGGAEPSGPVQEATHLLGERIVASHVRERFKDLRQASDEIKGMLNFKDSTQGVNRILVKENEMWIYYNDDMNLNNVMGDVIETLNAADYSYLEFNRLARSDNAIVFQISFKDTDAIVRPVNSNN